MKVNSIQILHFIFNTFKGGTVVLDVLIKNEIPNICGAGG